MASPEKSNLVAGEDSEGEEEDDEDVGYHTQAVQRVIALACTLRSWNKRMFHFCILIAGAQPAGKVVKGEDDESEVCKISATYLVLILGRG